MFRAFARSSVPSASRLAAFQPSARAGSVPRIGVRFSSHASESYDEFNERYLEFFKAAPDLFEVQRGMNNIWAYDLVPTVEVIEAIIQGARRFNDYPTAVRVLEGLKFKVQKKEQYDAYLKELRPMLDDLGIQTKEELFGEEAGKVHW